MKLKKFNELNNNMKKIAVEFNSKIFKEYTIYDPNDILDEEVNNFLMNYNNPYTDVLPNDYYPDYDMVIRYEDDNINAFISDFETSVTEKF